MTVLAVCFAGFVITVGLTGLYRQYAIRRHIVDHPNARSSHAVPTPRGGGIAFVIAFVGLLLAARQPLGVSRELAMSLTGCGGVAALLGFVDDHGHVPAGWRLLGHFAAAAWGVGWLGPAWVPAFFGPAAPSSALGYVTAVFGVVWLLNLYNFMDGIDGIASVEAIAASGAGAFLWSATPGSPAAAPLLLAACVCGFLVWNFPPARIFMGDVGSGFLGVVLAAFAMSSAGSDTRLLWAWGILLGAFIVDATVTLLRRAARRERVHQAHRSHAYQQASRRYGHLPVTLVTCLINVVWLFPIAAAVAFGKLAGPGGVLIAYAPLVLLVLGFRAGTDDAATQTPEA